MKAAQRKRVLVAIGLLAALAGPRGARGQAGDDTALFTAAVPPNVLLLVDNSISMNSMVWHPDYDPTATYSCTYYTSEVVSNNNWSANHCGTTRSFSPDPAVTAAGNSTRWDPGYLNWIFSLPNGDPRLTEINAVGNGTYSACLQALGFTTYSKYHRARVTAAKDVLREVVCNVNQAAEVRFGLAQFRLPGSATDPNGAFVRVPINDLDVPTYTLNGFTGTHLEQLDRAIEAFEGNSWTPLGESLFQSYTYFMSRTSSNRPKGVGGTTFPGYVYSTQTTGNHGPNNGSNIPPDPVQYDCQKNFVILITDGEPTKDDFDNANSGDNTAVGFGNFGSLIGNYNNDGETEIDGWACGTAPSSYECALYLDDIAKFAHERDFRPDRSGTQVIDVYTLGFTTSQYANDLLQRAAQAGGGLFFSSNSPEQLATAVVASISDIVQKAQSFTAATVPATRTSDGGNFYSSLFVPQNDSPFWEGHLELFHITADGDILDSNGACALLNPSPPGECKSGQIAPGASEFWDAGEEIPSPPARNLHTSLPVAGVPSRVDFDTSLTFSALGDPASALDDLTLADLPLYVGSGATTVEELADAIIETVRGCELGTGVTNTCVRRPWLLGDVFHSNPLVVANPRGFVRDASYAAFRQAYATRDRVVYAGANDGFLHAFEAGQWDPNPLPPAQAGYDRGTGEELFGFMPWRARRNIRHYPIDKGARDYYFVDGSPAAADVWFYPSPTTSTKALDGSEWHTILVGGLRQGGDHYYALDITDPDAPGYPGYLWEFPAETAPASLQAYMGETWGQPILTRVEVEISGQVYERTVAVVTGGYHPTSDPNDALNYDPNATAGRAIFLIDVTNGQILAEKKFEPAAGDERSEMLYAIATTPSVFDLDSDGFADVIYVGDLGGNLWKWVVAYDPVHGNVGSDPINAAGDTNQPNWAFRRLFQTVSQPGDPLGATVGSETFYKSIFFSPAGTLKNGTLWLSFGTGERANLLRQGDASSDDDNDRFYSIKDLDPLERQPVPNPTMTEQDLLDVTDDASCFNLVNLGGFFFRGADGEKFITNAEIFAYWVITNSFTPSSSVDRCNAGGDASLYIFNVYCSQGYFTPGGGLPSSPPSPGGGVPPGSGAGIDPSTRKYGLGAGLPSEPKISVSPDGTRVIVSQQAGEVENPPGPPPPGAVPGQLYWREVAE